MKSFKQYITEQGEWTSQDDRDWIDRKKMEIWCQQNPGSEGCLDLDAPLEPRKDSYLDNWQDKYDDWFELPPPVKYSGPTTDYGYADPRIDVLSPWLGDPGWGGKITLTH